ncbi:hypothetical protein BDZ91DRAFT_762884 [Kalaharituber pfeilii]|nr:hypothetical protein BDZ91DRAFT_762884 [Kalaharituber pfeilii]
MTRFMTISATFLPLLALAQTGFSSSIGGRPAQPTCCECRTPWEKRCGLANMCCGVETGFDCIKWDWLDYVCFNKETGQFFLPDNSRGSLMTGIIVSSDGDTQTVELKEVYEYKPMLKARKESCGSDTDEEEPHSEDGKVGDELLHLHEPNSPNSLSDDTSTGNSTDKHHTPYPSNEYQNKTVTFNYPEETSLTHIHLPVSAPEPTAFQPVPIQGDGNSLNITSSSYAITGFTTQPGISFSENRTTTGVNLELTLMPTGPSHLGATGSSGSPNISTTPTPGSSADMEADAVAVVFSTGTWKQLVAAAIGVAIWLL